MYTHTRAKSSRARFYYLPNAPEGVNDLVTLPRRASERFVDSAGPRESINSRSFTRQLALDFLSRSLLYVCVYVYMCEARERIDNEVSSVIVCAWLASAEDTRESFQAPERAPRLFSSVKVKFA